MNIVYIALAALIGASLLWGFWLEPRSIRLNRYDLPVLDKTEKPFTIAVVADLHVGSPYITLEKVGRIVAMTNEAKPDLILLPGDFVAHVLGGKLVPVDDIAAALKPLHAPLGVYAVLGNHDWWEDHDALSEALEKFGITVLENKTVKLANGLSLAGLSDFHAGVFDPGAIPQNERVLCMTHTPDAFPTLPDNCVLTIAGHTHGGQIKLPFIPSFWIPSDYGARYGAGFITEKGRHMFVSTGIGTSILPLRFGVPPEISLLTLNTISAE